jgi:hypothetical protein
LKVEEDGKLSQHPTAGLHRKEICQFDQVNNHTIVAKPSHRLHSIETGLGTLLRISPFPASSTFASQAKELLKPRD